MTSAELHRDFSHSSLPHHFKFGCQTGECPDDAEKPADPDSEGDEFVLSDQPLGDPEERRVSGVSDEGRSGSVVDAAEDYQIPDNRAVFTVGDTVAGSDVTLMTLASSDPDHRVDDSSGHRKSTVAADSSDPDPVVPAGSDLGSRRDKAQQLSDDGRDPGLLPDDPEAKQEVESSQPKLTNVNSDGKLPTIAEHGAASTEQVEADMEPISVVEDPECDHPADRLPRVAIRYRSDDLCPLEQVRFVNGTGRCAVTGNGSESIVPDQMISVREPRKRHSDSELRNEALDLEMSVGCYASRKRGSKQRVRGRSRVNTFSGCNALSRNVKTAPSTPGSENHRPPRHAESTSRLEMAASYGKKAAIKGMENSGDVKPPDKKSTASMSKSRNEKFHKLFKNIPEREHVLNSYLCAYVGDILLQGYFYILPSYFCFYTKILGHEKQLEIPVSEVINITREKTALIIPNAIGILTKKDKYVFGSLMSRDSTYRLMCNVWKKKIPNAQVTDLKASDSDSSTGQDYIVARDDLSSVDDDPLQSSASGSDLSDGSQCLVCGMPMIEHDGECPPMVDNDEVMKTWEVPSLCNGAISGKYTAGSDQTDHQLTSKHRRSQLSEKVNKQKLKQHTSSVVNTSGYFHSITRTKALLVTCLVISVILVTLAAFMSYKILLLQTQIDMTIQLLDPSLSKYVHSEKLYSGLYHLSDRYHTSTIERFHSILEANIEILSQVHASLFSLHKTSNLSGELDSCTGQDKYCKDKS